MKYMGSKRAMLANGLGELLRKESGNVKRIVDLFCGTGSVSWFAATQLARPVLAVDLQRYAAVLAGAVVGRDVPLSPERATSVWIEPSEAARERSASWPAALEMDLQAPETATWSRQATELCAGSAEATDEVISAAYGGHYFSPTQALTLDAMLRSLPADPLLREVCLAATIIAASKCAASPGHTAQPFKANASAGPYLREAWLRSPLQIAEDALKELCPLHAIEKGEALVANANGAVELVEEGDLVFIDPPYSDVHYSRFYHVLETIARGKCGAVSGVGRYPPIAERPSSSYSMKSEAERAITELLEGLSAKGCRAILTFPAGECSNGLSGERLVAIARESFRVSRHSVRSHFSTLGGNTRNRSARRSREELILLLRPV